MEPKSMSPRRPGPSSPLVADDPTADVGAQLNSVAKALQILKCFSADTPLLGPTELARRLGLHKSSVSRILSTLEEWQFVERDLVSGKLRLGGALVALAAPIMESLNLSGVVRPALRELTLATDETSSFNIWDGSAAVSIEHVRGTHVISYYAPLGSAKPPHCTAAGKALLAFLNDRSREKALSGSLRKYTESTITDRRKLERELVRVRQGNFATSKGEFVADVCAVAAAVHGKSGILVGCLAVTLPAYRYTNDRLLFLRGSVTDMASKLTRKLESV